MLDGAGPKLRNAPVPDDFECSALSVSAFGHALDVMGLRATALDPALAAALPAEAQAMLREPHAARWHPGRHLQALWFAVQQVRGDEGVDELHFRVSKDSMGRVVRPMVRVTFALAGVSPAAILSRMNSVVSIAVRHLDFDWAETPGGGRWSVTYPRPIPPALVLHGWKGVFRFGSELTDTTIRVDEFTPESEVRFTFQVRW